MDPEDADAPLEARPPLLEDLRDQDKVDLAFLARLLESRGETVD
jgi:hypothetical protein